jgi:hypothetical protein
LKVREAGLKEIVAHFKSSAFNSRIVTTFVSSLLLDSEPAGEVAEDGVGMDGEGLGAAESGGWEYLFSGVVSLAEWGSIAGCPEGWTALGSSPETFAPPSFGSAAPDDFTFSPSLDCSTPFSGSGRGLSPTSEGEERSLRGVDWREVLATSVGSVVETLPAVWGDGDEGFSGGGVNVEAGEVSRFCTAAGFSLCRESRDMADQERICGWSLSEIRGGDSVAGCWLRSNWSIIVSSSRPLGWPIAGLFLSGPIIRRTKKLGFSGF